MSLAALLAGGFLKEDGVGFKVPAVDRQLGAVGGEGKALDVLGTEVSELLAAGAVEPLPP